MKWFGWFKRKPLSFDLSKLNTYWESQDIVNYSIYAGLIYTRALAALCHQLPKEQRRQALTDTIVKAHNIALNYLDILEERDDRVDSGKVGQQTDSKQEHN